MSTKVQFALFSGSGNVRYDANGVDLSEFSSTTKGIDRPLERSFASVNNWLMKGFKIDPTIYEITVKVIVNTSTEGCFWDLMVVDSTETWKRYLEMAFERQWYLGIVVSKQAKGSLVSRGYNDGEGTSEPVGQVGNSEAVVNISVNDEPSGVADEAERFTNLVNEMERDDSDNEHAEDGGSSDEEEDVMPSEMTNDDFSSLVISDGQKVEWEYKDNEVIEGARYAYIEDLKDAVKRFAVSLMREFYVHKSSKSVYEVRCAKEKYGCPWRVHAYKGKWKDYWKVSIVTEHSCHLAGVDKYHRNLTSAFIAGEMYGSVVDNLDYEPRSIICRIEEKYKYTISYAKAWRAKQKIVQMRFGTFEASYDNLPRLLHYIVRTNSESCYDLQVRPIVNSSKKILERAFFAIGACIKAFRHCRPILCIDGTFLTGKYRGTILTAIGVDGDNQVLPVAFAFVESESIDSWYWFLERVNEMVVQGRPDVCLIHDRHRGLLTAIDHLKYGSPRSGAKWSDVQSRWCMRHIGANFYKRFKNKDLMNLFKRLCVQNQRKKFIELWRRLDELTAKQTSEMSKRPEPTGDDAPEVLSALDTDPPNLVRRNVSNVRNFSNWIEHEPKEKWSLLHDTGGARFGIMTTNLAEIYNWVMRGARGLPLVGIVEFILYRTQKYFIDRFKAIGPSMADNNLLFSAMMTKYIKDKTVKALDHRVKPAGTRERRFEVACADKGRRGIDRRRVVQVCVLNFNGLCSCSCNKPELLHRPCSHVLAACGECGILPNEFVSPYFRKEAIFSTWDSEIYGFAISGQYTGTRPNIEFVPAPGLLRGEKGRRKTKRIRNSMDESEAGARTKRCSRCNKTGHTYKKCPKDAEGPINEASSSAEGNDGSRPEGEGTTTRQPRPRRGRGFGGGVV